MLFISCPKSQNVDLKLDQFAASTMFKYKGELEARFTQFSGVVKLEDAEFDTIPPKKC